MRIAFFAGILAAFFFGSAVAQAAPLEAYGQLPTLDNLAISPDGSKIAFATTVENERVVVMRTLADGKVLGVMKTGSQKLRDVRWASEDILVITLSVTHSPIGAMGSREEYFMSQTYDLRTHHIKQVLGKVEGAMNVVLGAPDVRSSGGKPYLYVTGVNFVNGQGTPALFMVDLENDMTALAQPGTRRTQGFDVDAQGAVFALPEYDRETQVWRLRIPHGGELHEIFTVPAQIETPVVVGMGPDGHSVVFTVPDDGEWTEKHVDLTNFATLPPIGITASTGGAIFEPMSERIIGLTELTINTTYRFFDPADQKSWDGLTRAFPGENVDLVTWSKDRKHVVVQVDGPNNGSSYFYVDLNTHKANFIGDVYSAIPPTERAPVKVITYKAADGREIPAYLTLPRGKPEQNLPLIVLPHGGPAARDMPEFDWWSQALASRGYAVLQPEFRGSDGFGWGHMSAGFGEWGRKMQTDLSDGVRFLAKQGMIDAKRVCIVGASYGGYAALAGATLDRGVYRCAVSVAGVSDPHSFLKWDAHRTRTEDTPTQRYWKRFMGVTDIDDPKLAEISPLAHAADTTIPILLIHGQDDTVVPIFQSEDMDAALRRAGKNVSLFKLGGEDHWLSKSETRLSMLQETVRFLEANNPPN